MPRLPRRFCFINPLSLSDLTAVQSKRFPQPRTCNTCRLSHTYGLASSAFARHYSRNHGCFLFLWVLRCFTSPRSLQPPYTFRRRSPVAKLVTFEVSPFGHPRIKARLPAPQGLSQVTTSFIGSWCLGIHRSHLVACHTKLIKNYKDARVHCEVLNIRADPTSHPPNTGNNHLATPKNQPQTWPIPQDPTTCLPRPPTSPHPRSTPTPQKGTSSTNKQKPADNLRSMLHNLHHQRRRTQPTKRTMAKRLLRKEVIQPHLPVRLPCYDLVLITSPTFDGSPQKVGPPASGVTDFHDLTGGVYKPRERIHRSVADLRLLATPTSWGRVADPNPN